MSKHTRKRKTITMRLEPELKAELDQSEKYGYPKGMSAMLRECAKKEMDRIESIRVANRMGADAKILRDADRQVSLEWLDAVSIHKQNEGRGTREWEFKSADGRRFVLQECEASVCEKKVVRRMCL